MGKQTLFKNDFLNIKRKLFLHRVTVRLKNINHLKAKQLEYLLNMTLKIGIPCNEEEESALKWVCDKYDTLIGEINDEMERVKRYVMLKQGERNLVSPHVGGNDYGINKKKADTQI